MSVSDHRFCVHVILSSNKYLRVDFGLSVTVERLNDLGNRLW